MPAKRYTSYRPKNTFPPDVTKQSASNGQLRDATVRAVSSAADTATRADSKQARIRIGQFRRKLAHDQVEHDELTSSAYDSFDDAIDTDGQIQNDDAQNAALHDTSRAINRLTDMKNNVTYYNGEHLIDDGTANALENQIEATKDIEQDIHDKMKEASVENDEGADDANVGEHYYANGKQDDLTDVEELADRLYKKDSNQLNPNVVAALAGRFM